MTYKKLSGILIGFGLLLNFNLFGQVEVVSTGTGAAYVINVPAIFPLRNGVQVTFKSHVVSVASPTINVTGTGPILMKKEGGATNLAAGDIKAGQIVHLAYDGSFWQMLSLPGNPPPVSVGGSGTQNFVSKWNNPAGTVLGNSSIFDDGINVGVGTASPFSQFHIFGMNPNLILESSSGNFQTGYVIKTALNQWFLGQEGTSASGFRITDVDAGFPRFQIDQNGNVGIGTTTPFTKLHVAGDNPSSIVNQVAENGSSNIQSGILMQRSRGSVTGPSAVLAGDQLGGFYVMGYDGSAFGPNGPNAGMFAVANQNFGTGVNGTNLYFETTPDNTNSAITRMSILANGDVGIGTMNPNQKLEVQDGHILLSNTTGTQSELRFKESSFNGGNIISFKAPAFLSANINYTLPMDQGGFNDVLSSDGSGGLFWQPAAAGLSGGTLNYLPKWTSVNSLSSTSLVYDDGTHVGIGTTLTNTVGTNTRAMTISAADAYSGSRQVGLELRGSEGTANTMLGQINFVHGSGFTEMSRIETRTGSGNITHGQLAFYTNYSDGFLERMRISDAGNVGVGTASPGEKIQVFAPTTAAISIVTGNTSRARYYLGSTSNNYSGAIEYNNANNSMNFWTNNTVNRLVIDASGNVAIGNGTPTTMFSVGASSQFQVTSNGNITRINNVTTSFPAAQGAASTVLQNDGAGNLSWVSMSTNAWGLTGNSGTNPGSNFVGTTDNDFVMKGGTGASIRLNHSANTALHTASQHTFTTSTGTGPGLLVTGSGYTSSMIGIQRNAAVGTAGNPLGSLTFGASGSAVNQAEIMALRDAASSGSTDIPTALVFLTTTDGSSTAGERMRIDNAGNIGIGTSSPLAKLNLSGTTNSPTLASISSSVASLGTQRFQFSSGDVLDVGFQSSPVYAAWMQSGYNGSAEHILLNPLGGNVGIGNTNPTTQLHVQGGARITNLVGPGTVIADASGNLSIATGGTITGSGTANYVAKWTPTGTQLGTGLIYDNNSVVGIGTGATPSASRLHVHSTSGSGNFRLTSASTLQSATDGFSMSNDGTTTIYMTQHENADWIFATNGGTTAMAIKPTGDIGIGTTTPSAKLDVIGDIEIPAANDYSYATAKTNYVSISPVAFIPESSTYFRSSVSGYIYLSGGTFPNTGEIHAPVSVPNGAVITEVRFYISDNDATNDFVYLQLFRYTLSSGGTIFSSVTIPTGTFALSSYAVTPNYTVDNSLYQYMIRVGMPQNSSNHKLYGVRITYTITKAD